MWGDSRGATGSYAKAGVSDTGSHGKVSDNAARNCASAKPGCKQFAEHVPDRGVESAPGTKPEVRRKAEHRRNSNSMRLDGEDGNAGKHRTSAHNTAPAPKPEDAPAPDTKAASEGEPKADKPQASQPEAGTPENRKPIDKPKVVLGAVAAVAVCVAVVLAVAFAPITVTVNGTSVNLVGQKTLESAVEKSGVTATPGNLVAVDGSLIEEGAGNAFSATVNGTEEPDPHAKLSGGEVIEVGDGKDTFEEYETSVEAAPRSATIEGTGAVHRIDGTGQSGKLEVRTGTISGLRAETITQESENALCTRYNVDAGGQKAIVLTFDDGPNNTYTPQILDILRDNGALATFFTIGYQIEGTGADIVKRAYDEGHQICTHTWDHAAGSGQGVNLSYMSAQEQVDEVLKGYEAIKAVTGADASTVIRTPGGNFPEAVVGNLAELITYEIGWNIDTCDWQKPGVSTIRSAILSAKSGDIILMHDGGGNRAQTVQALAEALPLLASEGYSFVTVDQLIEMSQQGQGGE